VYDKLQNYGLEAVRLKQKGLIVNNMCPVCCSVVLLTTWSLCYSQGSKLQQVETQMLCLVRRKKMISQKVCNHEAEGTCAVLSGCSGSFAMLKVVHRWIHFFWNGMLCLWAIGPQCCKGLWCLCLQVLSSPRRINSAGEEFAPPHI